MMQEFDELSARSLETADTALAHIAETEQLTDAENDRIAANVLGRIDLTPVQPAVKITHSKKRRTRLIGAIIAAVLTVGALGIGASGWLTYNKPLMQSYFGSIGDERLAALELPEPQTFSNGIVNATVEVSLRDSNIMRVLMTFESADETKPINWKKLMNHDDEPFVYNMKILDENGEPVGTEENPITDICFGHGGGLCFEKNDGIASVEYQFNICDPEFDAEAFTVRFENQEQGSLDVTIPVTPCLETALYETAGGRQMTVSPINFRTSVALLTSSLDESWRDLLLNRSDGTQSRGYLNSLSTISYSGPDAKWSYSESMIYEVTEGMEFVYKDPETYTGFVDISDVDSIEWNGETYIRISE